MRAIQVTRFGGPDVLVPTELPDPEPRDGELLIDITGVGVNYADTHQAEDSYLSRQTLPFVPGSEALGTVVGGPRAGERVCGFVTRDGAYASRALLSDRSAFTVPDGVEDGAALALLVQGLTAWHLLRTSARMQSGDCVVVHAAAGGVGSLAVQLARLWSAGRIIATASSEAKLDLARSLGADAGIVLSGDEPAGAIASALRKANDSAKVDVVLEMVGGSTFDGSLMALAPFGRLATFGTASRTAPSPIQSRSLMVGSKAIVGFWLVDCMAPKRAAAMVAAPLAELVDLVASGDLRPQVAGTYALEDARRAHEDLRARRTLGKVVLDPRLTPQA